MHAKALSFHVVISYAITPSPRAYSSPYATIAAYCSFYVTPLMLLHYCRHGSPPCRRHFRQDTMILHCSAILRLRHEHCQLDTALLLRHDDTAPLMPTIDIKIRHLPRASLSAAPTPSAILNAARQPAIIITLDCRRFAPSRHYKSSSPRRRLQYAPFMPGCAPPLPLRYADANIQDAALYYLRFAPRRRYFAMPHAHAVLLPRYVIITLRATLLRHC